MNYSGELIDGRYRLGSELGAGHFGSVYRAQQVVLGQAMRPVALKLFHSGTITKSNIGDVFNDARVLIGLLSELSDWEIRQHFITVFDLGMTQEDNPRGYMAMELVGGSLEGIARNKTMTLPGTLHYLQQIVRAMTYMHEAGFVHSDLKPANILRFRGKQYDLIKIGDFGLAGKYQGLFSGGPSGGTTSYLPLEALDGSVTTPMVDVFCMGLLAYELLTGSNPYDHVGESLDRESPTFHADFQWLQRQSRLEPLRLERADFPELESSGENGSLESLAPLLDIINKMLAPMVAERFLSAGAVAKELARVVQPALPAPLPPNLLAELRTAFEIQLNAGNWSDAARTADQLTAALPTSPEGYLARCQVTLGQARAVASNVRFSAQLVRKALTQLQRDFDEWRSLAAHTPQLTASQVRRRNEHEKRFLREIITLHGLTGSDPGMAEEYRQQLQRRSEGRA